MSYDIFDRYDDFDDLALELDINRLDARYFGPEEGDYHWDDYCLDDDLYFVNAPAQVKADDASERAVWEQFDSTYNRLEIPRPHRRKWFMGRNLAA